MWKAEFKCFCNALYLHLWWSKRKQISCQCRKDWYTVVFTHLLILASTLAEIEGGAKLFLQPWTSHPPFHFAACESRVFHLKRSTDLSPAGNLYPLSLSLPFSSSALHSFIHLGKWENCPWLVSVFQRNQFSFVHTWSNPVTALSVSSPIRRPRALCADGRSPLSHRPTHMFSHKKFICLHGHACTNAPIRIQGWINRYIALNTHNKYMDVYACRQTHAVSQCYCEYKWEQLWLRCRTEICIAGPKLMTLIGA